MKPVLVTPPANDPITLEDVKAHLRVFYTDDDDYLKGLISAAVAHLDGYHGILNRCIVSQSWKTTPARFCRRMETIFTDTTGAVIRYYDRDGVEQTVSTGNFKVYPDHIRFNNDFTFPDVDRDRDDPISITTTHGYSEIPETLKLAMKVLVAHWYRNREPVTFGGAVKLPFSVDRLLTPHRWAF